MHGMSKTFFPPLYNAKTRPQIVLSTDLTLVLKGIAKYIQGLVDT